MVIHELQSTQRAYLKGICLIFLSAIYQLFIKYLIIVFNRQKE